jgi:hypothetical protein
MGFGEGPMMSDRRLPDIPPNDFAALKLAIEMRRGFSAVDARQIDRKLEREDWLEVARFAANSCSIGRCA